uniref:Protein Mis18-alpha n=1 Tax=Papio anubis TaxID=9555 RepID=A0A096NY41_PAPAN
MAGVRALRCSRGCAGGCECGDKGKGSDSSLLGKRLSEDSSRHQLLQKWASMWSSMSEEASVADTEKARLEEAGAAEERPLVFLCCGCRRPLGDSLSWVASQEDTNCILLRCVSCNVSVDKEQKLSKREKENGCILETLYCAGCSLNLGYVYRCTPKNLDYKRDLFCLSVEAIERVLHVKLTKLPGLQMEARTLLYHMASTEASKSQSRKHCFIRQSSSLASTCGIPEGVALPSQ